MPITSKLPIDEIHDLCRAYKIHLIEDDAEEVILNQKFLASNLPDPAERLLFNKLKIIKLIQECKTIHLIVEKLEDPNGYESSTLKKNRTGWARFLIKAFFTVISSPISVPLLILWSLQTRGTFNFLKSDGAIVIDEILKLCRTTQPLNIGQINENSTELNTIEDPLSISETIVNNEPNKSNKLDGMNLFFSALSNLFFSPEAQEVQLDRSIKLYTGSPYILNSRFRPFNLQEEGLLIDIYCGFQWSNKQPELATIVVFTNLDPFFPTALTESNMLHMTKKPSKQMNCFFKPKFQEILEKSKKTICGIDEKEKGYLLALDYAETNVEVILALEGLINELSSFHTYTTHYHRADPETCQTKQDEVLAKINTYIERLPADYLSITPSANAIQKQFNIIFERLQNNNIKEAWLLFSNMPPLSAFIRYNFLHLCAIHHQLNGVFNLIIIEGYHIKTIEMSAPKEQEIIDDQLNSLYIHMENGSIYCSVKNKMGKIDKFIITDQELGKHAAEFRELIAKKDCSVFRFSNCIQDQIYRITSQKGYFRSTENSIPGALLHFSNAYDCWKQYRPECANRMLNATINPLKEIKLAGESANETTLPEVRKKIAIREQTEIRRKLQNGEKVNWNEPPYDAEQWEQLLHTNGIHANISQFYK